MTFFLVWYHSDSISIAFRPGSHGPRRIEDDDFPIEPFWGFFFQWFTYLPEVV